MHRLEMERREIILQSKCGTVVLSDEILELRNSVRAQFGDCNQKSPEAN